MPREIKTKTQSDISLVNRSATVLGAGISGLAAAKRLEEMSCRVEIYEKNDYLGGHVYSHQTNGFVFDEGPHVSFTTRPEIQSFLAEAVGGKFFQYQAQVFNYWRGFWIRHPAQCNLYGLPVDVVEKCLIDFFKAQCEPGQAVMNYADWCRVSLGQAFSEEFTFRYTRKFWTTEASNMSTDWIGERIYKPKPEEILRGALAPQDVNHHYITEFRYPEKGGFHAYAKGLAVGCPVHLGYEVTCIDLKRHELEFSNGKKVNFEYLVSSLPVNELIRRIKGAPTTVVEAANHLACTSLVLVNIGIQRNEGLPDGHWLYYYDEDVIFARINFPHRFSPNNVPPNCASIQAEVYYSKYRPLPCQDVINKVVEDMVRTGLLHKDDQFLLIQEQRIPYANILFDLDRLKNLEIVRDYLKEQNIVCCGRYGEWEYYWSDDSIVSGWHAVDQLAKKINLG